MEQVAKTAANGRYLRPFAKIILALAARRENQDALAQTLLRELKEQYPDNTLFASEYAKAMGQSKPTSLFPLSGLIPPIESESNQPPPDAMTRWQRFSALQTALDGRAHVRLVEIARFGQLSPKWRCPKHGGRHDARSPRVSFSSLSGGDSSDRNTPSSSNSYSCSFAYGVFRSREHCSERVALGTHSICPRLRFAFGMLGMQLVDFDGLTNHVCQLISPQAKRPSQKGERLRPLEITDRPSS
jgi:hypothetical protein